MKYIIIQVMKIVNKINNLFFDCLILFEKINKTSIGIKEYIILKFIGEISLPNIKYVRIPANLVGSIEWFTPLPSFGV